MTQKTRLLVMNGQRIVQTEAAGDWANQKVDKAGALRPGIYNLFSATPAAKDGRHDGQIVHADAKAVYQKVGKAYVLHERSDFDIVPAVGAEKSITYDANGKAVVSNSVTQSRGLKR